MVCGKGTKSKISLLCDECKEFKYCLNCFTVFHKSESKHKSYCSDLCKAHHKKTPRSEQKIERICLHCNDTFETTFTDRLFCSKACALTYLRDNPIHKELYQDICPTCKQEFSTYEYSQMYCSETCKNNYGIKKIKDNNKNNYDDELLELVRIRVNNLFIKKQKLSELYHNYDYIINYWKIDIPQKLVDEIRERDGDKCYVCQQKYNLHVHHIVKRINGGEHSSENLITLCSSCHRHVETNSFEDCVSNCFKNAKKNNKTNESNITVSEDQIIKSMYDIASFILKKDTDDDFTKKDIMKYIIEILEIAEEQKMF